MPRKHSPNSGFDPPPPFNDSLNNLFRTSISGVRKKRRPSWLRKCVSPFLASGCLDSPCFLSPRSSTSLGQWNFLSQDKQEAGTSASLVSEGQAHTGSEDYLHDSALRVCLLTWMTSKSDHSGCQGCDCSQCQLMEKTARVEAWPTFPLTSLPLCHNVGVDQGLVISSSPL